MYIYLYHINMLFTPDSEIKGWNESYCGVRNTFEDTVAEISKVKKCGKKFVQELLEKIGEFTETGLFQSSFGQVDKNPYMLKIQYKIELKRSLFGEGQILNSAIQNMPLNPKV